MSTTGSTTGVVFLDIPLLEVGVLWENERRWAHLDSNQEPTNYEFVALTVELWALLSTFDEHRQH